VTAELLRRSESQLTHQEDQEALPTLTSKTLTQSRRLSRRLAKMLMAEPSELTTPTREKKVAAEEASEEASTAEEALEEASAAEVDPEEDLEEVPEEDSTAKEEDPVEASEATEEATRFEVLMMQRKLRKTVEGCLLD